MELDDLKLAWQSLDQELQRKYALDLAMFRDRKHASLRGALRPLFWGQIAQMLCGILVLLMGVSFWTRNIGTTHYLVSGLSLHIYGIALAICSALVLNRLRQVEYGAPVVTLQKQLLLLEKTYVGCGWIVGLPWWILWVPFTFYFAALVGIDLYALHPAGWLWGSTAVAVIGIAGTVSYEQWALHSTKPGRAERLREQLAGASLRRARAHLAQIEAFENENGQFQSEAAR